MLKSFSKIQNYINHVVLVLDKSQSMSGRENNVVKVADAQIKYLAKRSQELNQETRISTYLFGSSVTCLFYDMDVMRLPSLENYYAATDGSTALIDSALVSINELEQTAQLHGDHSFLLYYITDGQNNVNNNKNIQLKTKIESLPENWTLGVFVPNANGVQEAKRFGFPAQNISVWSTTSDKGMEEVGETMTTATDNYMRSRASGQRGTKNLFKVDASALNSTVVKNILDELKPKDYDLFPVQRNAVIKPFVESWTGKDYVKGSAYYQLTKKEIIQANKEICVRAKRNGKVYTGQNARKLLGLPDYELKVEPTQYGDYEIYIQSTSLNRNILKGTNLIVLK